VGGNQRVFHWDGAQWAEFLLPPGSGEVSSLWFGDSGLFASSLSATHQFDGNNWLAMETECDGPLSGLGQPWMACGGAILVYQGDGWGRLPELQGSELSARSRGDVYAAVTKGQSRGLFHFDGVAWTNVPVVAGDPDFVAATSDKLYLATRNGKVVVLSASGEQSLRGASAVRVDAVWANDADLVVVPEFLPPSFVSAPEYRISWKDGGLFQSTVFANRTMRWTSVHGAGNNVVVIGNEDGRGVIVRFDGTQWLIEHEIEKQIEDVWVHDENGAVVVGTGGLVLFYQSGTWSEQALPATQNFISVSGTSMSDIFAITEFDEIWHFDGNQWTEVRGLDAQRLSVQAMPNTVLFNADTRIDAWIR
jgi:hypothetical protein